MDMFIGIVLKFSLVAILLGSIIGVGLLMATFLERAHEVFILWYIYSFFFVLFLGLNIAAARSGKDLPALCGSQEALCKNVYHMLTDVDDEIGLALSLAALAIIPQLLAYILSGLVGAASPPRYFGYVRTLCFWSIAKFCAGLGGILTSSAISGPIAVHGPFDISVFYLGLLQTLVAFVFACSNALWSLVSENIDPINLPRPIAFLAEFFRRNIVEPIDPNARYVAKPHKEKQ
jgi:hypothetical protein